MHQDKRLPTVSYMHTNRELIPFREITVELGGVRGYRSLNRDVKAGRLRVVQFTPRGHRFVRRKDLESYLERHAT